MPLDRMRGMPEPGPETEIVRLKAGQTKSFVILSRKVHVYRTHWNQKAKQTIPCFTPHEDCEGHRLKLPQRAKGYLHVLTQTQLEGGLPKPIECFLEVTPVAHRDLLQGCGCPESLRGIAAGITRLNGVKAHLRVQTFPGAKVDLSQLPEEKSPYASVMTMWGFLDFPPEDGQDNLFY